MVIRSAEVNIIGKRNQKKEISKFENRILYNNAGKNIKKLIRIIKYIIVLSKSKS